ncbi:phosphatase [Fischerella thermalis CCMEE 5273]|nr:phosphatase [Fischerella thermalis CCMEE 5273]
MKLVVLDMDGTLLDKNGEVSEANKNAIKNIQAKNIEVIIATGRHYADAIATLEEAGLHCPVISVNGGDIRDKNGDRLWHLPIKRKTVQQIIEFAHNQKIYVEVYTDQAIYTTYSGREHLKVEMDILMDANSYVSREALKKAAEKQFQQASVTTVSSFEEVLSNKETNIYKILFFSFENTKLKESQHKVCAQFGADVVVSSSGKHNIEMTHPQAQKGYAVQKIADRYGIQLRDILAIGDNLNDLSMLRIVGHPVAMGNAETDVKNEAEFVTNTNDEDGVAFALEKYFPNELP